jgi:hypothetical protein
MLRLRGAPQHPEQGIPPLRATNLGLAFNPSQTAVDQFDVRYPGDMMLADEVRLQVGNDAISVVDTGEVSPHRIDMNAGGANALVEIVGHQQPHAGSKK